MRIFDYSRLKGRTWDSELLGLVAQLHEYKGRQEMYLRQKPADLDRLIEIAKIQSTEASNEIEGIRTTNTRQFHWTLPMKLRAFGQQIHV